MTLAALLVALYAFIAGLVAGWVMEPDTPATSTPGTPVDRDPVPWWLVIAFGLAWPFAAVLLVLLVGSWRAKVLAWAGRQGRARSIRVALVPWGC